MDPELEMQAGEMSPWASRRKTTILAAAVLLLSAVSFGVFWKFWYAAPTCQDGIQNGDETGVDCGGSCSTVCRAEALRPIVRWDPRMFEVSPGVWSAVVYVDNPNVSLDGAYAPYIFKIYGEDNQLIEEREGATILPKGRTVGIFEGAISPRQGKPKRATFELGENVVWKKNETAGDEIQITHSPLLRLDSAPRVEAVVKNNGIEEIENIELVIAIFDGSDNAIAASRTFVEKLNKNESTNVFFTWSEPFRLGSKACEKPSNVVLLLDRSGSMAAPVSSSTDSLSVAKEAAKYFVDQLRGADRVGVISFASQSKEPIETVLTSDLEAAKKAIESVGIETGGTQYTNVFGALRSAWQELARLNDEVGQVSAGAEEGSSKIVVLLTDGVANYPKDPDGRTEADDIKYAEGVALAEAENAKESGIDIYTIGLGGGVNGTFLKALASAEENYFFAPTATDLQNIYEGISSDICEEVPARIEITYKIFGDAI